jgi:hypothetical protein
VVDGSWSNGPRPSTVPPANSASWALRAIPPLLALACAAGISEAPAAPLAVDDAIVITSAEADTPQRSALTLFVDEAQKRMGRRWPLRIGGTSDDRDPTRLRLIVAREDQLAELLPAALSNRLHDCEALKRDEGYSIQSVTDGNRLWILVSGHDDRGMLYGLGHLLRHTDWSDGRAKLDTPSACVAPALTVRGHQLGYRAKNNTYDGWTTGQFEQYIRDLAIFGTNTIELLPPLTDDAPASPLFPQPALETMVALSGLIQQYGLRCSVFYPALAEDYSDPLTVSHELDAWETLLRQLPQVDELFVPGGDPGHTAPEMLLAFLDKLAPRLHRYHPNATIWVSTQGFNAQQLATLYRLVSSRPRWLHGIVFGPQTRDPIEELRARIPSSLPIRLYPDIAHTSHSQFPLPRWDPAFALTYGREPINPLSAAQARIFRHFAPPVDGFVTYSEGVNDDVNKFVWTALGVEPGRDTNAVLTEYARWFTGRELGSRLANRFARGLAALERNWDGPIEENHSIATTLQLFREIEMRAPQATRDNWRVQLASYRAWFDAYEQNRAHEESEREKEALRQLAKASRIGSLIAIAASMRAITASESALHPEPNAGAAMRAHIEELAGALFGSIRIQLSVSRYGASAVGRGATLDTLDAPLNDRAWLQHRFAEIRTLPDESQRLAAIDDILKYERPVAGACYDDLGEPGHEPHLVHGDYLPDDPGLRREPHDGVADTTPDSGWRRSWVTYSGALYDEPLVLSYDDLNPSVHYRIRVTYAGEDYTLPMRLIANDRFEIHPPRNRRSNPEVVEFDIPAAATATGRLKLAWTRPAGVGGSGRGAQVAEVWLLPMNGTWDCHAARVTSSSTRQRTP